MISLKEGREDLDDDNGDGEVHNVIGDMDNVQRCRRTDLQLSLEIYSVT